MRTHSGNSLALALAMAVTLAALIASRVACAADAFVYAESAEPSRAVEQGLENARAAGTLLLVVMGAQWCHDSTGLAEKFAAPEVASVLAAAYELVVIDVGYYRDLRPITRRFGQAIYYATPTVMIIDPDSERLLNAKDMHIWGSADSVPAADYVEYFSAYAQNPPPASEPMPGAQAPAMLAFEEKNAARLMAAYATLAADLQDQDQGRRASDGFMERWREVRRYRSALQRDIRLLRERAIESPQQSLVFPSYATFSWE